MSYIGKTPASAALTSSDITDGIISLPKLTDGTDGNIISYDASGNPVAVATGTDGQVLTSTGAGSPPAFETLASAANTPYFHAYSTSAQTLNHATETKKTFTTKIESASGVFDLTNNKFVCVTAGKYFLTFNLYGYDSDNGLLRLDILVKVNGTQIQKFTTNRVTDIDGRDFSIGNSFIANLDTDDYVEMFAFSNTADSGTISLEGSATVPANYMSGFKSIE
jgi:hypothetical protein